MSARRGAGLALVALLAIGVSHNAVANVDCGTNPQIYSSVDERLRGDVKGSGIPSFWTWGGIEIKESAARLGVLKKIAVPALP